MTGRGRLIFVGLGLLLAVALVAGAYFAQRYLEDWMVTPGPLAQDADVVLPRGIGVAGIAARLQEAGVITDAARLRLATRLAGRDRVLQAGEYRFPAAVTPDAALAMIEDGKRLLHRITIPEGWTIQEAWTTLEADDVLDGTAPPLPKEGSILPETYLFERGEKRAALAEKMETAMREALGEAWASRAADLPLDEPEQAVTLASIVEKETARQDEYPMVASVYVNRLRKGMPLQADPTVIYALTKGGSDLGRALTRKDLQTDDAYNTYDRAGLPPGPIALPGKLALEATVHPAKTDYLYFVADGTGGHAFAATLAEHNRNVRKWRQVKQDAE